MGEFIDLELIFVSEDIDSLLLKDEEAGEPAWISKRYLSYDYEDLIPNSPARFLVSEISAFNAGFI